MSKQVATSPLDSGLEKSDENLIEKNEHKDANSESLFQMLSPDLLLFVFGFIGYEDMNTYIHLADNCGRFFEKFIYKDCKHFWQEIDLQKFPGMTDDKLQSLLERVNARDVTTSLLLDKEIEHPITGVGLEPLRYSRFLERIDLRQSSTLELGPIGLNDQRVVDILSTVLPHKLTMIKVRKQFDSRGSPFDEYCFSLSTFFSSMKFSQASKASGQTCSHCGIPLHDPQRQNPSMEDVLRTSSRIQCTVCGQYTCRAWIASSTCPGVFECHQCMEQVCSCRQRTQCDFCKRVSCGKCEKNPLKCQTCSKTSCSECKAVLQCNDCEETTCAGCAHDPVCFCDRCKGAFCGGCRTTFVCDYCNESVCQECDDFAYCTHCDGNACQPCCKTRHKRFVKCHVCLRGSCADCVHYDFDSEYSHCSYCDLYKCTDDSLACYFDEHVCKQPGESVYGARNAKDGDDSQSLCACGKKHLTSKEGQQFICSWKVK